MKKELAGNLFYIQIIALLFMGVVFMSCGEYKSDREFYQIKTYNLNSQEQESIIDNYLQNAYIPALHRAGIKSVGVFKPVDLDTNKGLQVFVWIPFKSLEEFNNLPELVKTDSKFLEVGKEYINAPYDDAPFGRIESTLLYAFKDSPTFGLVNHETPAEERIYELRSYQAATEDLLRLKVEMFNEGGESKIFKDLGFMPLFFGEVISGSTMPNLMYMSTFSDRNSQAEHWKAFSDHPDWQKLKEVEKYKNTVSKIEKYILYPTEYSDI